MRFALRAFPQQLTLPATEISHTFSLPPPRTRYITLVYFTHFEHQTKRTTFSFTSTNFSFHLFRMHLILSYIVFMNRKKESVFDREKTLGVCLDRNGKTSRDENETRE